MVIGLPPALPARISEHEVSAAASGGVRLFSYYLEGPATAELRALPAHRAAPCSTERSRGTSSPFTRVFIASVVVVCLGQAVGIWLWCQQAANSRRTQRSLPGLR